MAEKRFFRQAALDRLASPEQLDRLVAVTDRRGWIALAALGGLGAWLLVWSLVGAIPTTVTGQGILLARSGQVADAMSQASGTLSRFVVKVDDVVRQGQVLAYIDQRETARKTRDAAALVEDQAALLARFDQDYQREYRLKAANVEQRRAALRQSIADGEARTRFLQRTLAQQESHAAQGFFSPRALDDSRAEISRVRQETADRRHELLRLDAELLELQNGYRKERNRLELNVNDARRSAGQQDLILSRDSVVTAPADGRVIELKVSPGAVVQPGQPVLSIEHKNRPQDGLQALVYMPTEHGKKLAPGMAVRLAPANVRKEEYGTLHGRVRSVSEFPLSLQGISAVLPNPTLAEMFVRDGPPYAVQVELEADPATASGYRWTSAGGPPMRLQSGTTASAEITVLEQRPITLLLPFLRKSAGLAP